MKRIAFVLGMLAASGAGQSPCFRYGTFSYHMGEWSTCFQAHDLKAQHFAMVQFVPVGSGIAALIFFNVHPFAPWYGETKIDTADDVMRWSTPGCERVDWQMLAVWWDDRLQAPRAGDNLMIATGRYINLAQVPAGMVAATASRLSWEPIIERQHEPPFWNQELTRPHMWAALIAPARGWW